MHTWVGWNSCTNSPPHSGRGCFSHMLEISETPIFFAGDLATCVF